MSVPKQAQAQVETLKISIEQLRVEAGVNRIKVSDASKDLMDYCEKEKANDVLVIGISDSQNPFQEKKSCVIL